MTEASAGRARRRAGAAAVLALLGIGAGVLAWQTLRPQGPGPGIASGNGRIEATEIDVATKLPGRVVEILADEGAFVRAGQVLARMDTAGLEAQRREARAVLERARIGVDTAASLITQREAERAAAQALLAQRQAEADAARRRHERSRTLAARGAISQQVLDDDRASAAGAQAAVNAARAQIAAGEAALGNARAQVVAARAQVEAAQATIERIEADLADAVLTAPRAGRVQYRVAEPGEVLAAGGVVLNLVDLGDVYMTFFLPTAAAGRVAIGTPVHLVLDVAPQYVVPARATFVADVAQFTPKTVETAEEREKLMFRIKARIEPELLQKHLRQVKTGLPGVAYVKLDPDAPWPPALEVRVPQ